MTYKDQPYYKEFLELLGKIQAKVAELKTENRKLLSENRTLSSELKDVRAQLSESCREVDALKSQLSDASNFAASHEDPRQPYNENDDRSTDSLPLFDQLSDNEKIALRHQITELIHRIDKHLAKFQEP